LCSKAAIYFVMFFQPFYAVCQHDNIKRLSHSRGRSIWNMHILLFCKIEEILYRRELRLEVISGKDLIKWRQSR